MKNLEEMGKGMPYSMPEGFMDDMTERVIAAVSAGAVKKRHSRPFIVLGGAVAAAAVALLLIVPSVRGFSVPGYDSISQCKSIDEMFQTMSADDLELFSMMSNYYAE